MTLFKQIPQQAGALGPSNTLSFQIASRTEFVDIQRSYLQFKLTPTTTASDASAVLQNIGATACFAQIQEQVCGTSLQFLNRYELYNSTKNAVASASRKAMIAKTEGYNPTGAGATLYTNVAYDYVVPCPLQTITSAKLVPLALFPGDYLVQILLNPTSNVFVAPTATQGYTISDVYLCLALVTPPREMFLNAQNTLNNGGDVLLPVSICRNFEQNLTSGAQISFNQIIGYYESLDAITITKRLAADINQGQIWYPTTWALDSWYISLDTERFPRNRSINAEGNVSPVNSLAVSPAQQGSQENLLAVIRPFNTQLDDKTPYSVTPITISTGVSTGVNNGFCYWNFQENSSFGSGKAVANGQFVAYLTYNTGRLTTGTTYVNDLYDVFIEYSIILRVTAGGVSYNSGSYA